MTESKPLPVVFIMGPTASGKTDLAVELVERLPMEIVSVDSAMIYRGMDIGTAKPESEVLAKAPHRLIDILDPAESYSVGSFRRDALAAIAEIRAAGRIPLLVGGTMLYFRALQHGMSELPAADEELRQQIEAEAAREGWEALHRRLAEVDPEAATRIHPNDPQRLQRALEVYRLTGRPLTELWRERQASGEGLAVAKLILAPEDRAVLHERIARRFAMMLEQGLLGEVEALYRRGDLDPSMPSVRCVGYRQVWDYLHGEYGYQAMVERGIAATRQFAKRQFTWLRREEDGARLDTDDRNLLSKALKFLREHAIH